MAGDGIRAPAVAGLLVCMAEWSQRCLATPCDWRPRACHQDRWALQLLQSPSQCAGMAAPFLCGLYATGSTSSTDPAAQRQVVCAHNLAAGESQSGCWAVARCSVHGLWLDGLLLEPLRTADSCSFIGLTTTPQPCMVHVCKKSKISTTFVSQNVSSWMCRLTGSDTTSCCDTEPGRDAGGMCLLVVPWASRN